MGSTTCSGFVEIQSGSEADLLDATSSVGPIRYSSAYMLYALFTSTSEPYSSVIHVVYMLFQYMHYSNPHLNLSIFSVVVDSSDITFQYYSSGIYCSSKCSKRKPNHAMLVVGYGTDDGVDYWILKNRYTVIPFSY